MFKPTSRTSEIFGSVLLQLAEIACQALLLAFQIVSVYPILVGLSVLIGMA